MKIKKLITFFITVVMMLCVFSLTSFAEDTTSNGSDYGVDSSYTVTIPEKITAGYGTNEKHIHKVQLKGVNVPDYYELSVKAEYSQTLTYSESDKVSLSYEIWQTSDSDENRLASGSEVLTIDYNDGTENEMQFYVALTERPVYAGTYTDTVTFTTKVDEMVFTMEDIENDDRLYAIGKTKPEYVVAIFEEDYDTVGIKKNGADSDGLMRDWTSVDDMVALYDDAWYEGLLNDLCLEKFGMPYDNRWTVEEFEDYAEDNVMEAAMKDGIVDSQGNMTCTEEELFAWYKAWAEEVTDGSITLDLYSGEFVETGKGECVAAYLEADVSSIEFLASMSQEVYGIPYSSSYMSDEALNNLIMGALKYGVENGICDANGNPTGTLKEMFDSANEYMMANSNNEVGYVYVNDDFQYPMFHCLEYILSDAYQQNCLLERYNLLMEDEAFLMKFMTKGIEDGVMNEYGEMICPEDEAYAWLSDVLNEEFADVLANEAHGVLRVDINMKTGEFFSINYPPDVYDVIIEQSKGSVKYSETANKLVLNIDESELNELVNTNSNGVMIYTEKTGCVPDGVKLFSPMVIHKNTVDTVTIKEGVKNVGDFAFNGCSLVSGLAFPESMTDIGRYSFNKCTGLTSVFLNNVETVGDYAYNECANVSDIDLCSVKTIGNGSFYNLYKMDSIVIPDSTETIGEKAFYTTQSYNSKVRAFSLGSQSESNLKAIGARAFDGNVRYISNIIIPDSVSTLGTYVFGTATNLTDLTIGSEVTADSLRNIANIGGSTYYPVLTNVTVRSLYAMTNLYAPSTTIKNLVIDGQTENFVGPFNAGNDTYLSVLNAGSYLYNLKSLYVTGVDKIGNNSSDTFRNCTQLTDVVIDESVYELGENAFYYCTSLKNISLNTDVISIGDYAFYHCTALTSFAIPENVTSVGNSAFYYCTALSDIIVGRSVKTIGEGAFSYCSALTSVEIPSEVKELSENLFYNCTSLTDVVLPEGLEKISQDAFYKCSKLPNITLPKSLTTIEEDAFSTCSAFVEITIPENVTSISSPFSYCSSLKEVTVLTNCVPTGNGLWRYGSQLPVEKITFAGNVETVNSNWISGNSALKTIVFGENVKTIGELAFSGCSALNELTIPDNILTIEKSAFVNCDGLTEVNLGNGITTIGYGAFSSCDTLTTVNLSNSLTTIGESAFANCVVLAEIVIPDSVTSIAGWAFDNCNALVDITIGTGVETIGTYAFGRTWLDYDNYKRISNRTVTFKGPVNSIDTYAFGDEVEDDYRDSSGSLQYRYYYYGNVTTLNYYGTDDDWASTYFGNEYSNPMQYASKEYFNDELLTNITLTDNLTSFSDYAFYNCKSLTDVTIDSDIEKINDTHFAGCPDITNLTISGNVTNIGDSAFSGKKIENLTLTGNITAIGNSAFSSCSLLKNVVIPDSIETIGSSAFSGCTDLTVTFNGPVNSIGEYAFGNQKKSGDTWYETGNVITLNYYGSDDGWASTYFGSASANPMFSATEEYFNGETISDVVVSDAVASISAYAFYNCDDITSVVVPHSVTSIGTDAFYSCDTLKTMNFTGTDDDWVQIDFGTAYSNPMYYATEEYVGDVLFETVELSDEVTSVKKYVFYNCNSLKTLKLGNSIETIGNSAIYNCDVLDEVSLTDSLKNIDLYAFYSCNSLPTITIPNSVTSIGNNAFMYCSELRNIVLSDGLNAISNDCFNGCTSLLSVDFPDKIETIGSNAFYGCSSIESVDMPKNLISIGEQAFRQCSSLKNLVLPDKLTTVDKYAFASCTSMTSVELPNSLTEISEGVFNYCSSMVDIVLPNHLEKIGYSAFAGCKKLLQIDFPESLYSIYSSAFSGCQSLTEFAFPVNVEIINFSVLASCSGLEKVVFEGNVTTIYNQAFYGCSSLTDIVLPDSLEMICGEVFNYCSSLEEITIPESTSSIANNVFHYTQNLKNIFVDEDNSYFADIDGVLFDKNLTEIVRYPEGKTSTYYEIPSFVDSLGTYAFYNCDYITDVVVPENILSVGENVYDNCDRLLTACIYGPSVIPSDFMNGCTYLNDIIIGDKVTSVSGSAFSENGGRITDANGVTKDNYLDRVFVHSLPINASCFGRYEYGYLSGAWVNYANFYGYIPEDSIYLPNYVTASYIDVNFIDTSTGNLLDVNTSLSVDYPEENYTLVGVNLNVRNGKEFRWSILDAGEWLITLPTIEGYTLSVKEYEVNDNSFIMNITGEENVVPLTILATPDDRIIENEPDTSVVYDGDVLISVGVDYEGELVVKEGTRVISKFALEGCKDVTSVVLPETIEIIEEYAFFDCSSLTSITIPNTTTILGDYAFYNCSKLITVGNLENVKSVGRYAFYNCSALTGVTLTSVESIENCAFYNCVSLSSVNTTSVLEVVKPYAFYNCSALTEINLEGLKQVRYYAFYGCSSLAKASVSDNLTEIQTYAFANCTSLESIVIPKNVTVVENYAFNGCSGATNFELYTNITNFNKYDANHKTIFDGCNSITTAIFDCEIVSSNWFGGTNTLFKNSALSSVVIGENVMEISDGAFSGCTALKNVVLNNGVKNIKNQAFYGCSLLTEVVIPDSVVSIGKEAFGYCKSLVNVKFGSGVKTISENAFSNCTSIVSVSIPEGVASISQWAFNNCTSLTSVVVPESITTWYTTSFAYCSALKDVTILTSAYPVPYQYNTNRTYKGAFYGCNAIEKVTYNFEGSLKQTLYSYANVKEVVIGDKITAIENSAFSGYTSLTNIIIGNNVETIGSDAFYGCKALTNVVIPNSVTSVGEYAFAYCSALVNIDLPDSLTTIKQSTFSSCTSLTEITIPETVTSIESTAFSSCKSLTDLIIPDSVETIGAGAFELCNKLTNVTVGKNIKSIGGNAFTSSTAIVNMYYTGTLNDWLQIEFSNAGSNPMSQADNEYINGELLTDIVIDGVEKINDYAFNNNDSIKSVVVSNQVKTIGNSAFEHCDSLTSVTLQNGVEIIGKYAFKTCVSLTDLSFANSVEAIAQGAFNNCTNLNNIYYTGTADDWVQIDFYYTFGGSYSYAETSNPMSLADNIYFNGVLVTDVVLTDKTTTIKDVVFWGNETLRSVVIPDSVTSIGAGAFYLCDSLTDVTLGKGVEVVDSNAFDGCDALTNMYYTGTLNEWVQITFGGYYANPMYYATNEYINGELVTDAVIEGVTEIKPYTLCKCNSLISVAIGNGVETIGDYAFAYCETLTDVTIPDSVTEIGASAFYNCKALTDMYYNGTTESWLNIYFGSAEANPMCYATNEYFNGEILVDIVIGEGGTVNKYAFYNSNCKTVTISNNVKFDTTGLISEYSNGAFDGCVLDNLIIECESLSWENFKFTTIDTVTINSQLVSFDTYSTYLNNTVKTLVFGDKVEEVTRSIFEFKSEYDDDEVIYNVEKIVFGDNVKVIADETFKGFSRLETVEIGAGIELVGKYAFANCDDLTNLSIVGSGETVIDDYAFVNCIKLTDLVIGDGIKTIGTGAFQHCEALTNVTLGSGIETIGESAFEYCEVLTEVTIPANVTTIGDGAFNNCPLLTTVRGVSGSYAETFASNKGYTFVAI